MWLCAKYNIYTYVAISTQLYTNDQNNCYAITYVHTYRNNR